MWITSKKGRAFQGYLPDDVLYRKKSAYPSTKDSAYLEGVSNWMLDVLDNPRSPILKLINTERVRQIAEGKDREINNSSAKGILDYLLQINAWLDEYDITLHL